MRRPALRPTKAAVLLAAILLAGLGLRLWGVKHGLPYVYNLDEGAHFVKPAVRFFGEGYNPHYFQNPPAFSYLLHVVFAIYYGGIWPAGAGLEVKRIFADDPTQLYTIARVVSGLLGLGAAATVYFIGKRLWGVAAGLIAAALMAFAFMPVHYGHLALNDSATLLPLALCMLASVYIYRTGSMRAYLLAGATLGLAVATKYTALAIVMSILAAFAMRTWKDKEAFRREFPRLIGAGIASVIVFFIANPFSLLAQDEFRGQLHRQQKYSGEIPKLGLDDETGWQYYLWTITWGFGWLPLLAAAGGIVYALKEKRQEAILLLSFLIVFWFFMGNQERFYARWFLPAYVPLAVFAGYGVTRVAGLVKPSMRLPVIAILGSLLLIQPLYTTARTNTVLTRSDTRELAHNWLVQNLPARRNIVVEPIASPGFVRTDESLTGKHIWTPFKPPKGQVEDYEGSLKPSSIDDYADGEYCTVVTGSIQSGRAVKSPDEVPRAIEYYKRLNREAKLVKTFTPIKAGSKLPAFNFDWSYDYYPGAYYRPGPEIKIYQLNNGNCAKFPPLGADGQ